MTDDEARVLRRADEAGRHDELKARYFSARFDSREEQAAAAALLRSACELLGRRVDPSEVACAAPAVDGRARWFRAVADFPEANRIGGRETYFAAIFRRAREVRR